MLARFGVATFLVGLAEVVFGSGGRLVLLAAGLLDVAIALAARGDPAWFSALAVVRAAAALVALTSGGDPEQLPRTMLAHAPGLLGVWCLAVLRALEAQRRDVAARPLRPSVAHARPPIVVPLPMQARLPTTPTATPPQPEVPRRSAPKWRVGTTPIAPPPDVTSPTALRRLLSERPTSIFLRGKWGRALTPTADLSRDETPTDLD